MKVNLLLRLYPRAWRERYGDELLALLSETPVTPAIATDLLVGAVREWIRAFTRQPQSPVSFDREYGRGWLLSVFGITLIAAVSWGLSRVLSRVGILPPHELWVLTLLNLYGATRALIILIRCARRQNRAIRTASVPPTLAGLGIGRGEYWFCIALLVLASTNKWIAGDGWSFWMGWVSLFIYFDVLRNSTRSALARRDRLVQLARAERPLKLATP
jgi:hypothetical protein